MNDALNERCILIKSIDDECKSSFSSFEKLYEIIQIQDDQIKKLEAELSYKEMLNRRILLENAQYSIEALKTLLHIIWPLTTKHDFQQHIIKNDRFIDLLFENLQSSNSSDLLFPLIGILSNLNSSKAFRSENGFKSAHLIFEKDYSRFLCNFDCHQVFLYLLYNISFDKNITNNLFKKSLLLEFIKEDSQRICKSQNLQNLFYKFLQQATNSLINDLSDEFIHKDYYLIQIRDICMNVENDETNESGIIVQIINRFFSTD